MIRKNTNGDISDEEFNAILKPFLDNSMDPEFHKDDCLIIRECKKMDKDGFYCVLEKDSNDGIMVMPLNMSDNIQPKTYLKGTLEFESLRIIGIVVQVKRKYI